MKILTLTLSLLATCVLTSSAMASLAIFSLKEAQEYCPLPNPMAISLNPIEFKAANNTTNREGVLFGTNNANVPFTSWNSDHSNKYVMQPKNNPIDIRFEKRHGSYGHVNGSVITCFYKYTGFTGIVVHPSMTTGRTS